jgi:hypothetical protein
VKTKTPLWRIANARGCAWRGRYLYRGQHLLARFVIDPNNGNSSPTLGFAFPVGWRTAGSGMICPRLVEGHIPLPSVAWRINMSPARLRAYQLSAWFWHKMDGRYGWGSK